MVDRKGSPAVNILAEPGLGSEGKGGKKLGRIDGRWCCAAHHWRTGWPPLERTGWPRQAGLGPRNPNILCPQHCAGRVEEACGDLSSKYAAGRQPGAGGWESTGARGAAGSGGWPTFALTPTSQQTGPGQNQASCELEGARSKKSCSCTLIICRCQLSSTKTFLSHACPNSHGGGKCTDLKTNGLTKEMGREEGQDGERRSLSLVWV